MGKQSARIFFDNQDHKDIVFDGYYHTKMYLTDENGVATLVWEKLGGRPIIPPKGEVEVRTTTLPYQPFSYVSVHNDLYAFSSVNSRFVAMKSHTFYTWGTNELEANIRLQNQRTLLTHDEEGNFYIGGYYNISTVDYLSSRYMKSYDADSYTMSGYLSYNGEPVIQTSDNEYCDGYLIRGQRYVQRYGELETTLHPQRMQNVTKFKNMYLFSYSNPSSGHDLKYSYNLLNVATNATNITSVTSINHFSCNTERAFVLVTQGNYGYQNDVIYTSTNGINWTYFELKDTNTANIKAIYARDDALVVVANVPQVYPGGRETSQSINLYGGSRLSPNA